jgi:mRNA interferase MazF
MIITKFVFGDIILINYPFSDLTEYKKRPCLVLTENRDDVLVVFISSKIENKENEDLIIKKDNENNLIVDSLLKLFKINNIHKNLIYKKIGELNVKQKAFVKLNLGKLIYEL